MPVLLLLLFVLLLMHDRASCTVVLNVLLVLHVLLVSGYYAVCATCMLMFMLSYCLRNSCMCLCNCCLSRSTRACACATAWAA